MKKNFRFIFSYLMAIAFSVVFALFCSARVGWFFTAALVLSPVLSLLLTLLFIRFIDAETESQSYILNKNEKFNIEIKISNKFFLPSPPVIVKLINSESVKCAENEYEVSLMPLSKEVFSSQCSGAICGASDTGIEKIKISDYFRMFSFTPKIKDKSRLLFEIGVIPDISEISSDNEVMNEAVKASVSFDDSENSTEKSMYSFGGVPGYDNREYIPGDPLKRINWKLSAKKNKLLVRLDDSTVSSAIAIVLDGVFCSDSLNGVYSRERLLKSGEKAIEESLGYVRSFLMKNYTVTYIFRHDKKWQSYNVIDENILSEIRNDFAKYRYETRSEYERIPKEMLAGQKSDSVIFCTPLMDEALIREIEEYKGSGITITPYSVINTGGDIL